ncbi:MAG: LysR family transcriptional regulator [Planctomycetota bacterium]
MQLRTFQIFCSVAEHRSFSRAAEEHSLTQSAVSQAMQHLEESLGVQLIDRSQRPLVLTTPGVSYLRGARDLLRRYETLKGEIQSEDQNLRGNLTIGTVNSAGLSYLPKAMEEFSQKHPEVNVRLEFGPSERVFEMTNFGRVDFGIVSFSKNTKSLRSIPWLNEPMRVVCSSDHPLAERNEIGLSELQGLEMVGFERGLRLRTEIDKCLGLLGISVDVTMEFDNADSAIRAIQANRGLGILPEAAIDRETAIGSLKVLPCSEFKMTRPVGIIIRRAGHLSQPASEFGSLLLGRRLEDGVQVAEEILSETTNSA